MSAGPDGASDGHPDASAAQRCVCANIRRTDRVITQFYDEMLAPIRLNAPQFGLLAVLAEVAPVSINGLADVMAMDRTTLTRNLGLLSKKGLVRVEEGEDRRVRIVLVTTEGEQALQRAWPLWEEAQSRIEQALGRVRFDALLVELEAVRASIR